MPSSSRERRPWVSSSKGPYRNARRLDVREGDVQKLREREKTRGSLPSREDIAMLEMMFARAMSEHITGFEPTNCALRAKHNVCRMMLGQRVHALR
jgi:hypothetical protein